MENASKTMTDLAASKRSGHSEQSHAQSKAGKKSKDAKPAAPSTARLARRMDWWLKKQGAAAGGGQTVTKPTDKTDEKSGNISKNKTKTAEKSGIVTDNVEEGKPGLKVPGNPGSLNASTNPISADDVASGSGDNPKKSNKRKREQEGGKEEKVKGPDKVKPKAVNQKAYVIFVGNFSYDVTQEDLVKHFGSTGGLKAVRLLTHKETGKSRGCAYVEFDNALAHKFGLHLHESTLCGSKINVEFTSRGRNTPKRQERLKEKNKRAARFKRMREVPE